MAWKIRIVPLDGQPIELRGEDYNIDGGVLHVTEKSGRKPKRRHFPLTSVREFEAEEI